MTEPIQNYLIYEAWSHHMRGVPFPVDVYADLLEAGIVPERLERMFHEGVEPPLDALTMAGLSEGYRADEHAGPRLIWDKAALDAANMSLEEM